MKKCANCAKDLPEAALHCVFCGAKQAAAPAVQPGLAKTAFGYSANEVMQQLGSQPQQGNYQQPRSQSPSQGGGYGAPPAQQPNPNAFAQTAPAPVYNPPQGGYGGAPQGGYGGAPQGGYGGAPQGGYGGAPQGGYGGAPQGGYGGAPHGAGYGAPAQQYGGGGMGIHSPPQPTPQPLPTTSPPYLASQTAARAGRPIEPWKDSLKLWMLVWGAVALVAFVTPLHISPLAFNWDLIIHGLGKMKILPLMWATVAFVSVLGALLPMESLGRGIIATVLGLAGVVVPIALIGEMLPWQIMLQFVGALVIVPGLLVRDEYVESLAARVMVTIGVACILVPYIVPSGGEIPLVGMFKHLIDAEGSGKIEYILEVLRIVLVVMCLLAWMPGPATGGAKPFAWALILFPVVEFALQLVLHGDIGDAITKQPGELLHWVPGVTYAVLGGYGLATVIGKQLE